MKKVVLYEPELLAPYLYDSVNDEGVRGGESSGAAVARASPTTAEASSRAQDGSQAELQSQADVAAGTGGFAQRVHSLGNLVRMPATSQYRSVSSHQLPVLSSAPVDPTPSSLFGIPSGATAPTVRFAAPAVSFTVAGTTTTAGLWDPALVAGSSTSIPVTDSAPNSGRPSASGPASTPAVQPDWRLKDRMKTVGVGLILALNIGT
jgi:hypothetical protein